MFYEVITEQIIFTDLSDELLERKIDYCNELLEVVDILDPGYSVIRAQILNELQAAMAVQAKRQFNDDKITKEAAQVCFNSVNFVLRIIIMEYLIFFLFQQTLMDAIVILKEVIEILKTEPEELEQLQQRLLSLSQELDD